MTRLYLDSCCIIYLLEASSPLHRMMTNRILRHRAEPDAVLITSRLARLECRVAPLRDGNSDLLRQYDSFFSADRLLLVELAPSIIERATELRVRYRFKTPDAIHLATAIEQRATTFLTNDAGLQRCTEVTVEVLASPGT